MRRTDSDVDRFLTAWFSVRQFIQAANFNRFQAQGLSATQFMTLNLLPEAGKGLAMGELARKMNLAPATVAKTVDSLEQRSLVTRFRSSADKRLVFVEITAAGSALQNNAQGHFRDGIQALFETMPSKHRQGLLLGLESLVRVAQGHPEAKDSASTRALRAALPAKRNSPRSHPQ